MKPLWTRFLLLVVAGLTLVAAGWFSAGRSEGSGTELVGVSQEQLAKNDVTLLPLEPGQQTRISRQEAEETVASRYPAVSVRQTILVRLVRSAMGEDNPVWVINLDPQDKDLDVYERRGGTLVYFISYVDANTGTLLFSSFATATPPGGWPPRSLDPINPPPLSAPASPAQ